MTAAALTPWTPPVRGIREVLHATFAADSHAYPMHTHDSWTLLVVDTGAVRYRLHGAEHHASAAQVTLLPPHVPHDGCAAGPAGFRKRVVYLEERLVDPRLVDRAVRDPARTWRPLLRSVDALHRAVLEGDEPLWGETALEVVLAQVERQWGTGTSAGAERDRSSSRPSQKRIADQLRLMLDASVVEGLSLHDAAATLGCSSSSLVHGFHRHVGMPPHRYLVSRRVDLARRLLLEGRPAAEAAVLAGFHDQAHLTRHFKRLLGVPPAAWAASRVTAGQRIATTPG